MRAGGGVMYVSAIKQTKIPMWVRVCAAILGVWCIIAFKANIVACDL